MKTVLFRKKGSYETSKLNDILKILFLKWSCSQLSTIVPIMLNTYLSTLCKMYIF